MAWASTALREDGWADHTAGACCDWPYSSGRALAVAGSRVAHELPQFGACHPLRVFDVYGISHDDCTLRGTSLMGSSLTAKANGGQQMQVRDQQKPGDETEPGSKQSAENLCPECSGTGKAGNKSARTAMERAQYRYRPRCLINGSPALQRRAKEWHRLPSIPAAAPLSRAGRQAKSSGRTVIWKAYCRSSPLT